MRRLSPAPALAPPVVVPVCSMATAFGPPLIASVPVVTWMSNRPSGAKVIVPASPATYAARPFVVTVPY
jgi:hypothetical protein